jgi:hypothetical protein
MNNKLHLVESTVSLTCPWAPTGDPRMLLARVWTAKAPPSAKTVPSSIESGRIHLCA